jgi:hypothetical protein
MAQILNRKHESKPVTETPLFDWRKHLKVHPAAELFPPLSPEELQVLANDIKANGLHQRIVLCGDPVAGLNQCQLVDGRSRLDALALLGFLGITKDGGLIVTKRCTTDRGWIDGSEYQPFAFYLKGEDPYALALSFNVHRRHLTVEQKRDLIAKVLKAKPEQSNNTIAKQVKADDKTVAKVRTDLERRSEIPNVSTRTDSRGRKQPAKKTTAVQQRTERHLALLSDGTVADLTTPEDSGAAKTISAKDIALESFDAHVLELLRLTKGQKPERFAKTAVTQPLLGDLAHFLRELVRVRKDPDDASAEPRKAEYAAGDDGAARPQS